MSGQPTQFPAGGVTMRWHIGGQPPVVGAVVHSWQHASEIWGDALSSAGIPGASQVVEMPVITDATGAVIAHVSYNGRVWSGHGHDWRPGAVPVYDPRTPLQTARADAAYAAYEFGDGVVVEGNDGWAYTTPGHEWTRRVYVRTDESAETSDRLTFVVRFDDIARVTEVYAVDSRGQIWGSMPNPASSNSEEPEGMRP